MKRSSRVERDEVSMLLLAQGVRLRLLGLLAPRSLSEVRARVLLRVRLREEGREPLSVILSKTERRKKRQQQIYR